MLTKDGLHNLSYYGEDVAGNKEKKKNVVIKIDSTSPNLSFTKPEKNYLYVGDKKILPLSKNTVVVGKTKIEVMAADKTSGIAYVKFFRDGEKVDIDEQKPYEWEWNEVSLSKHEIKAIAYDNAGNHAQVNQTIFFLALF